MEPSQYQPHITNNETTQSAPKLQTRRRLKSFKISDAVIFAAFAIIMTGLVFNWASNYDQPPEEDDFSEYVEPYDEYQNALEKHESKINAFEGIYDLFSSLGVVLLVAGIFFKTTMDSEHLPDWVRVVMMAGVLYFMIRIFTTELSLVDQIALFNYMN
ncbi:MAG: hypothetical protein HOA11_03980 [Euryarchaeota archaeon]|nr:hypothetical protein [Euryarchaeota archaeon]